MRTQNEATKLVMLSGATVVQAARDLGFAESIMRRQIRYLAGKSSTIFKVQAS